MGIGNKIKRLFGKVKQHVEYECRGCGYETARKHFDTKGDDLVCPRCESTRVYVDD